MKTYKLSSPGKTLAVCFTVMALGAGLTACDVSSLDTSFENNMESHNNIVLNTHKKWTTSKLPAYIGDISSLPQELQAVIQQRFPKSVDIDRAHVLFVGPGDMAAQENKIRKAADAGAFIVSPKGVDLSIIGASPMLAAPAGGDLQVLLQCYSSWNGGVHYVMFDEINILSTAEPGTPSMSEEEWKELIRTNVPLGDDGGLSVTDYDNLPDKNENYYQTRMDPFIQWIDSAVLERSLLRADVKQDYDDLRDNIEQSGQRLTYNYSFTLNKYIDQAILSDADYLCKNGSISVEYRVYPLYMLEANGEKGGDYYGVVSTVTPHNESMWGPYVGAHGACRNRIYGFWFCDMDVVTSLLDANGAEVPGLAYFDRPIPENKNDSKTYSNGKTFSMNGSISGGYVSGGAYIVGNFGLGGTWTSSTNYTLETISYSLDSSSPSVKYHYWSENVKLTDDWDDGTQINQNFPAPVRTEFSGHSMWVWHVPNSVVKDSDQQQFQLKTSIKLRYSTWYHWRGAVEYDSNRANHDVDIPSNTWKLNAPYRVPWGFIRLRNATNNEMAHVAFYPAGQTGGDPVAQLSTSYGKGEEARIALVKGTYDIIWDIIDGDTNVKIGTYIYKNVDIHTGYDDDSATVRISTVDGQPYGS